MMTDEHTPAPSAHCTLISSAIATENCAPTSSARISAPMIVSISQPSSTSGVITATSSAQELCCVSSW
jgi:hypothetical protein